MSGKVHNPAMALRAAYWAMHRQADTLFLQQGVTAGRLAIVCWLLTATACLKAAEPAANDSPADHLPSHISRLTWFGERADWSHDGKRMLFMSKTFGDALEIDLARRRTIRNLTRALSASRLHPGPVSLQR